MTTLQTTITGEAEITDSPAIVVRRFLGDWGEQLEGINYQDTQMKEYFVEWIIQKYGLSKSTVMWLIDSRAIRTLQEFASDLRNRK